jgi:hypothetical protein
MPKRWTARIQPARRWSRLAAVVALLTALLATVAAPSAPQAAAHIGDNLLARSAWPTIGRDARHQGWSPYAGPATPGTRGLAVIRREDGADPAKEYQTFLRGVYLGEGGAILVGGGMTGFFELGWSGGALRRVNQFYTCCGGETWVEDVTVGRGNAVYVTNEGGYIRKVVKVGGAGGRWSDDPADGGWRRFHGFLHAPPALYPHPSLGPLVLIISPDGYVAALRERDGVEQWRYVYTNGHGNKESVREKGFVWDAAGRISFAWSSTLFTLTPDGGEIDRLPLGVVVSAGPVLADDGRLYLGAKDAFLQVDPAARRVAVYRLGSSPLDAAAFPRSAHERWPALSPNGDTVYYSAGNSLLYAMDPDDWTTPRWVHRVDAFGGEFGGIKSDPLVDRNGVIYVYAADGYLYAINPGPAPRPATAGRRWKYGPSTVADGFYPGTQLALDADGAIYVATSGGGRSVVWAVGAGDGSPPVTATPAPSATRTPTPRPPGGATPTPTRTATSPPAATATATATATRPAPGGGGPPPAPGATTWHFAEGNTGDGFDEYLTIMNPQPVAGTAAITYYIEGQAIPTRRSVPLPAASRITVAVHAAASPSNPGGLGRLAAGHATTVESTVPIVVERPIYFRYSGSMGDVTGGHTVMGATAPRPLWYFAEGTTRAGFDQYLTILNPQAASAQVAITYYRTTTEGVALAPLVKTVTVDPTSRRTVAVHEAAEGVGREYDVSAKVEGLGNAGIVVERPTYFRYAGAIDGGHNVMGASGPATRWHFAEGYTGTGFDEYLTIMNPAATAADLRVTYYRRGHGPVIKGLLVPPTSRATVAVHEAAHGVGRAFETAAIVEVVNGVGVVVERPMYFAYGGAITGGHDVMGAPAPRPAWRFAEGFTGTGFDQYLTILNPNADPAPVTITYLLTDGAAQTASLTVAPTSRATVHVHDTDQGVGRGKEISAIVETAHPGGIIVERPIYFTYNGATITNVTGGHNVMGYGP